MHPSQALEDLVHHVGRFPPEAFVFVREGLQFAVEQTHGEETEAHKTLYRFMGERGEEWSDLVAAYLARALPEEIMEAIDDVGGCEKLNRHVSGRDLCWGLRDYAIRRWGMLARQVLESWSVSRTDDFGQIVFGFIELKLMQKQSHDTREDFHDVFDFEEAFDEPFKDGVSGAYFHDGAGDD